MKQSRLSRGFTFIELIIVFTVITILATLGLASFSSYSSSQEVASTASDLKTLLFSARSLASSQTKPSVCPTDLNNPGDPTKNAPLVKYEVDFCNPASGMPAGCRKSGDYEVNAFCGNGIGYVGVMSKTYATDLTITTTYRSYSFPLLTGGVDHGGTVTITGKNNVTKSITISASGVIQ